MSRASIRLILVLAPLALGMAIVAEKPPAAAKPAAPPTNPNAEERTKAFTWFNTLGFPDVKGRKLVRVATGRHQLDNEPPQNTWMRGFLLEDNAGRFTVLTLSLTTEKFEKTPATTPAHEQVGYEASELATAAAAYLENLRNPPKEYGTDEWEGFRKIGDIIGHPRTEVFVLAWACWRNGLDKLAADLYDHASKMPTGNGENADAPPTEPLRKMVADDLACVEMRQAIQDFADIPRTESLKRFERISRNYPDNEHHKQATAMARLLRQMVEEDTRQAQKPTKPFGELCRPEQITALIFQLRDQVGYPCQRPGYCDIFSRLLGNKDTPAHRLVDMGYDAAPQLIDALEDARPTRAYGYHLNFYMSRHFLTVGDCALLILEEITGKCFYEPKSTYTYMSMYGMEAETKKKAQKWYADFKNKGEMYVLIEGTERGDESSFRQARRLLERYPDAALPSILKGIKAARNSFTRDFLVQVAADIKNDSPIPFLLEEVKEGPYIYGRIVAARSLSHRGRPEGLAAMMAEWQGRRPARTPPPGEKLDKVEKPEDGLGWVAEFLAGSDDIDAIKVLARDLRNRPVKLRHQVIGAFITPGLAGFHRGPKALRAAITDLLVAELDDMDVVWGYSSSCRGKSIGDPRLCDVAANALNENDPQAYPFDETATVTRRNKCIVEMKNVWRKDHGLAPLAIPVARTITPLPKEKLQPLVDELLRTPVEKQGTIEARILTLGVATLPALRELVDEKMKDDPARAVLERLSRRVGCVIEEVVITKDSVEPEAALAARIKALRGKTVDDDALTDMIQSIARKLPTGVHGVSISMDRSDDSTGVTLQVNLLRKTRARSIGLGSTRDPKTPKDTPYGWSQSVYVEVGKEAVIGYLGGCDATLLTEKEFMLRQALSKLCSSAPNEPIEARLVFVADLDP